MSNPEAQTGQASVVGFGFCNKYDSLGEGIVFPCITNTEPSCFSTTEKFLLFH